MSHEIFPFVVIASTAIDAVAAGMILLGRRGLQEVHDATPIGIRRLLLAMLITGLVFLLKLVPLSLAGLRRFGVIHLVYADLTVLLPSIGLALLGSERLIVKGERWRRLTTPVRIAAMASLVAIPVGIDATWIEPFRLQQETRGCRRPQARGVGRRPGRRACRPPDGPREPVRAGRRRSDDGAEARHHLAPGDVFQGERDAFEANRGAPRPPRHSSMPRAGFISSWGTWTGPGRVWRRSWTRPGCDCSTAMSCRVSVGDRRVTIAGVGLDVTTRRAIEAVDRTRDPIPAKAISASSWRTGPTSRWGCGTGRGSTWWSRATPTGARSSFPGSARR